MRRPPCQITFRLRQGGGPYIRTCPPQVVGTEALYADLPRGRLDYTPDGAVAKLIPVELASFRHRPKQLGVFDRGGRHPCIDSMFDPHRNGNRADPTTFATHIDDDPSTRAQWDLNHTSMQAVMCGLSEVHPHPTLPDPPKRTERGSSRCPSTTTPLKLTNRTRSTKSTSRALTIPKRGRPNNAVTRGNLRMQFRPFCGHQVAPARRSSQNSQDLRRIAGQQIWAKLMSQMSETKTVLNAVCFATISIRTGPFALSLANSEVVRLPPVTAMLGLGPEGTSFREWTVPGEGNTVGNG